MSNKGWSCPEAMWAIALQSNVCLPLQCDPEVTKQGALGGGYPGASSASFNNSASICVPTMQWRQQSRLQVITEVIADIGLPLDLLPAWIH